MEKLVSRLTPMVGAMKRFLGGSRAPLVPARAPGALSVHELVTRESADLICLITTDQRFHFCSPSVTRVLGYAPDEILGDDWRDYVHPDDLPVIHSIRQDDPPSDGVPLMLEKRVRHKDGRWIWLESNTKSIEHPAYAGRFWMSQSRDVSERKADEIARSHIHARLAEQAAVDSLTGLFNRRHIMLALNKESARAAREARALSVLLIDVDHFKPLNDHYGHQTGDLRLKQVATTIARSLLRPADLVGRYGGEEFLVLLPGVDHAGMAAVAEKIRSNVEALAFEHVCSPFGVVTLSIGGVYVGPDMHSNPETYVKIADDALYEAKRRGRNRIVCLPAVWPQFTGQPAKT